MGQCEFTHIQPPQMSTIQANDPNPQDVFYGDRGATYAVTKKAPSGTDNTDLWGNSRVTAIKRWNDALPLPSMVRL